MKLFAVLAALAAPGMLAVTGAGAATATPEEQVMAPIRVFVDGFNKGALQVSAAMLAPNGVTIIDDLAPHLWSGATAFDAWSKALGAADQAAGISDEAVSLGKPTRLVVGREQAYVVVPVIYTYKMKTSATRESAQMVYTMVRGPEGWLISSFTWVGTKPEPAAGAAK